MEKLARRILRLEREVRHLGTTPQLAHSSVEGGHLTFNDDDGTNAILVGVQPDGTNAPVVVSGPNPATPAGCTVIPFFSGALASWDGTWEGTLVAPLDFARIEIHASQDPGFVADVVGSESTTLVGSISSARGGRYAVAALGDGDWYFRFVARSLPGKFSDATAAIGPVTPDHIQTTDIADEAVTAAQLADEAVEARALAPGAVDSTKIADFSVLVTKMHSTNHLIY